MVKVRKLVMCALGAMGLASGAVYGLVPVSSHASTSVEEAAAPAADVDEVEEAATPAEPEEPGSLAIETRVGHSTLPLDATRRTYVMVELVGEPAAKDVAVPTFTALVLDTSGSMKGERIRQAALAARRWIDRSTASDTLTVVGFAQRATVLVEPTPMTPGGKRFALSRLANVQVAGDTCLSCGFERALDFMAVEGMVQRVVVLSDGKANIGMRGVPGMSVLARKARDRRVSSSTIGLGIGYDEKALVTLASEGNGLHHFVNRPTDLAAVFEREEETVRATVANRVSTTIDLAEGVELVRVFGRPFNQSGQRVHVDVGPIGAGATRTVLMEVSVPLEATDDDLVLANASIAYRDLQRGVDQRVARRFTSQFGEAFSELDGLVAMRLERARTAEALQKANELFTRGDKQQAVSLLDSRVKQLKPKRRSIPKRAARRGDNRAGDIERDIDRQMGATTRARDEFQASDPMAPSGQRARKASAPMWAAEHL